MFVMIDTCQASSMYEKFYSPNVLSVASSLVGEDSLSHHVDSTIGVYIIDRYTYYALEFLEKVDMGSSKTIGEFLGVCPKRLCISTVGVRRDLYPKDPFKVPLTDFFGSVRPVQVTHNALSMNLTRNVTKEPAIVESKKKARYLAQVPDFDSIINNKKCTDFDICYKKVETEDKTKQNFIRSWIESLFGESFFTALV